MKYARRFLIPMFVILAAPHAARSQAAASLSPAPRMQFFDNSGRPLAGGCIQTFQAGSSTPLATYSDAAGTANTNPVVLDSSGRADIWLGAGQAYKITVRAKTTGCAGGGGTILYTADNVIDQGFSLARGLQNGSLAIGLRALPLTGTGGGTGIGNAMLSATTDGLYVSINGAAPALLTGGGSGGTGTPGGPTTSIQYNGGGSLAGSANLKWDNGGKVLIVCGAPATGCSAAAGSGIESPLFSSFGAAGDKAFITNVSGGAVGSSYVTNSGNAYFQGVNVTATFNSLATGSTSAVQQVNGTFEITGAGDAGFQSVGIGLRATPLTGLGGGTGAGNAMLSATTAGLYLSLNGAAPALITGGGGSGTPGTPTTSIQYNNAGTFAGSANLSWNSGSNILIVCNAPGTGCSSAAGSGIESPLFSSFGVAGDKAFITNVSGGATGSSYITNSGNAYFQGVNVTATFNSLATGSTSAIQQANGTFTITGAGDAGFQSMGLGLRATPLTGLGGGTGAGNAMLSATTAGLYISLNGAVPVLVGGGGSGTPGAPSTSIQFNNAGTFAGSANLLWDNTNGIVTLTKVGATSAIIAPIFNGNVAAGGTPFKNSDGSFTIDAAGNGFMQTLRLTTTLQSQATGTALGFSTAGAPGASINGQGDGSFRSVAIAGGAYGLNNAGVLTVSSCTGCGGAPATPVNSVQFNNGGVFGGNANFTWDNTNSVLNSTVFSCTTTTSASCFKTSTGNASISGSGAITGQTFSATSTYTSLATGGTFAFSVGSYGLTGNGALVVSSCSGCAGTPATPVNSVQFNNGGVFGGNANFNWDNTNGVLNSPVFSCTTTTSASCFKTSSGTASISGSGAIAGQTFSATSTYTSLATGGTFAFNVGSYGLTGNGALTVSSCSGCGGAGVTSLTSSGNGITFSASTGAITASLAQDLRTFAAPSFAAVNITGTYACNVSGTTACITTNSGTFSINGNGTFLGQSIATGSNNGSSATAGQGATISNSGASIGMVVYDSAGHCNIGTGAGGGGIACSSDARLKKNIVAITDGLGPVMALKPSTFMMRASGAAAAGFIAQDVQRVLPGLVSTDKAGYLELSELGIIPYLVRSVQQLQAEVDTLRSRVGVRLLNEQLSK